MKTAAYIKLDVDVKAQAQHLSEELGLSLSTLINAQLKQFIRHKKLELSVEFPPEQMTPELEAELQKIASDKEDLIGPFTTPEQISQYFKKLRKSK